ncbi:MATE family efflux transporter [Jannaschia sp. M317]|uniref:MATE family efflux transporter n=1 Tax=Jannaschia sp. M317 TaxID=2867011 RepID=UPI0021A3F0D1|nr:MATE family efflux transporter [Jannaschia sp. M317]UWQ19843.1 hypothetical protein K3551_19035 [Jannaschia sp. M317]
MSSAQPAAITAPGRTVLGLAWPMALKAIILHGTVVIDAYLVAGLGETALAAMGIAAALAGFVLGTVFAFANAMQLRVAQAWGSGDPVFLKSALGAGLSISAVVGAIGLLVLLAFGGSLIARLAPTPEVAVEAWRYLSIFSLVILGEVVGQCLSSYANGCGRTRLPLYSYTLSLPINVAVSVVLIHGYLGLPALGVVGAAIGSVVAVSVQVAFLAFRLLPELRGLRTTPGWRGGSFATALRRHLAFVLPIAATFVSATIATQICALIYARLSLNGFAAITLIGPWIMIAGTLGMQWAQATGIVVAQLLGQRLPETDLDRFLSKAWRAGFYAAGLTSLAYLAVCLSANWLYDDLAQETRTILLGFLPILLVLPFPKQSNAICGNTLRASGDTVYVMALFLWTQWLFRVPATALAILWLDLSPFWVLSILLWEEVLKFPAFHSRLRRGDWKRADIAA